MNWVYIAEDGILQRHCRENLNCHITLTGWICIGDVMCLVRYELGFYIVEDGILHARFEVSRR
jgi:hypothetical protein